MRRPLPNNFAHVEVSILERNMLIKGITMVNSTANKSSFNSFGDSKIQIPVTTTRSR